MKYRETEDGYEIIEEYNASIGRKSLFILILALVLAALFCFACTQGSRPIDFYRVPSIIWDHLMDRTYAPMTDGWWDDFIVCEVWLPRIIIACVAGASLAICGAAVQSLMNNPLASPYTMGMSSGACFGAVLSIVMGFSMGNMVGMYGVSLNAFVFGMIPVILVILIAQISPLSPVSIILIGVAVSQFFGSLTTLVEIGATEDSLQTAYLWQVGDLDGVEWGDLPMMGGLLIVGSAILMALSWKFNVLTLGDDTAKSLGVDATVFRVAALTLLALMTMSVICITGIIGFVGMVAPHIIRFAVGGDNKFVLPASLLSGAILLLAADTVSRLITTQAIPVGAVMAFIGGPIFIFLILRRNSLFAGVN